MEVVPCPYCGSAERRLWATELGFAAVRCVQCALIYVSPRPSQKLITAAVRTGAHGAEADGLRVVSRRVPSKVGRYQHLLGRLFDDVWRANRPISWVDVGAGYGEVVEAVGRLAPQGSVIEGLEPMAPKAADARARGLPVVEDYLRSTHAKVGFISLVDVFSHIPDFSDFLADISAVLEPHGEIFIETGNLADLQRRDEFPGELGLPDHLVFAGEEQLRGFLERAGFEIVRVERLRIDGVVNLLKNFVKKTIGRPAQIRLPYRSKYRQLLIRARLRSMTAQQASG
jgi:SAM-dependent methyltransferase